jgi:Rps23 Pro-64 3,4-dihydroxylase Tpa1-like proline 4-hydroxylase
MIKVFKDFITLKDQEKINETILSPKWKWGHASDYKLSLSDTEFFWQIHSLEKEDFYSVHLLNKIKEVTGDDFTVERIYLNGHTACSQGNLHKDTYDENGRTFLIYCNENWNPEHGGGTMFMQDDEITTYYPYSYSAIYFKNNIDHCAAPISKMFKGLRVTLAFKLYKI